MRVVSLKNCISIRLNLRRRQRQLELEESRNNYSDLYDFAPVGYLTLSDKGVILDANLTSTTLLGVNKKTLPRTLFSKFVSGDCQDTYWLHLRQVFGSEKTQKCELKLMRRDGVSFDAQLASTVVAGVDSPSRQCRTIVSDITDRKRADETIWREREFSEHLIRSSLDGILAFDRDYRYTIWNPGMERISGVPREKVLGKSILELFPFMGETGEDRALAEVLSGKTIASEDRPYFVRETNREGFFDAHYAPLVDEKGDVVGGLAVVRDTTERKRNEEALRNALDESRKRSRETSALLESSRAILGHRNLEASEQAVFDACRNLIGSAAGYIAFLSADEMNNDVLFLEAGGLPCAVDPSLPMPVRGLRAEAYRSGKPVYENDFAASEWAALLPDGHAPLDNVMFVPLILEGKAVGIMGFANKPNGFTDEDVRLATAFADHAVIALQNSRYLEAISESELRYRRLSESLEETVKKKVAELAEAEWLAAIGRMVPTVAHEIRNPLQNIQMGVDTLGKMGADSKDRAEILEEINHGIDTLNTIVGELLEYTRPLKLLLSPATVPELVRHCLNTVGDKLAGIEAQLDFEQEDREISVDIVKFTQVLVNLMQNAIEAMPGGGTLKIRSRFGEADSGDVLRLSISDTGIGIKKENLDNVFEPFFTTKTRGTGLGLAVCKKYIEGHSGTVEIHSRVDKGTTVEISLPV
jgi:PAS domain S-box-containing protein